MDQQVERPQTSQLWMGTALVLTGLIFFGQQMGWGPEWSFRDLWPIPAIAIGLIQLVTSGGRRGYFWLSGGVLFLLDQRGVMPLRDSWPLLLVAFGLSLLFGRRRPGGPTRGGRSC